jgi:hypothetical protein
VLYIGLAPTMTLKVMDPSIDKLLKDFSARTEYTATARPINLAHTPVMNGKEANQ